MRASVSKWAVGVVCFLAGCARVEAQTAAVSYGGIGDPASAPGDPAQSYALSGLDHVNYYNGQLNLTIPAYSIGGRGSVARNIVVQVEREWAALNAGGSWTPFSGQEDLQGAEVYTGGYVTLYDVSGNASQCAHTVNGITTYTPLGPILSYMVYTAADGTETVMRDLVSNGQPQDATLLTCSQTYTPFDRGKVFQSSDGSDLTFVANSDVYDWGPTPAGTLITRDGTKYSFGGNYISQIEDRNGNQISFAFSSTNSGGIYTVTDPLGRTPTINFTEDPATDLQDVITYEGVGGSYPVVPSAPVTRTVKVNYALLGSVLDTKDGTTQKLQTYSCLFPELSGSSSTQFDPYVVSSVVLADGTSYSILYNSYGEPARLTLPTGAYYVYRYAEASNCAANTGSGVVNLGNGSYAIYRRVQERDEYASGTNLTAKILFSAANGPVDPNFGSRATTKATVVFEDQNSAVLKTENHYFYGNPAPTAAPTVNATQFADWWLGREYRTEIVDPTQGTQQTTQMAYGQRSCPGAGESNCWYTVSADTSPAHDTQLCPSEYDDEFHHLRRDLLIRPIQ